MKTVKIVIEKEPECMYHKFKGSIYANDNFAAMIWFNTFSEKDGVYHFRDDTFSIFGILADRCELVWATETVSPEQLAAEALI